MQFSLVNGSKSAPFSKGEGLCPACGNKTIAKCGSVKVWHWAHASNESCDPWWENETPWHRAWKAHWNIEYQEIAHTSEESGERHIADVKNSAGLVLEFQNSPMNDQELASREAFYGNMVWVVNGSSFFKNVEICAKLPGPENPLSQDMRIYTPQRNSKEFLYWLVSENEPGATMVEVHGSHRIQSFVDETHTGHHLFMWKHPRGIWFRSKVPVYFDFGGETLWQLIKFNAGPTFCLRVSSKADFIVQNGGQVRA